MYLKFGESSTCLAKKIPVKLWNCWRYKFSAKMKVPMKDGIYKITVSINATKIFEKYKKQHILVVICWLELPI